MGYIPKNYDILPFLKSIITSYNPIYYVFSFILIDKQGMLW